MTEQKDAQPSRIHSVTLFEDRAELRRRLTVVVQPGDQTVRVGPITAMVDERSLQVLVLADQRETEAIAAEAEAAGEEHPPAETDSEPPAETDSGASADHDGVRVTAARVVRRMVSAAEESEQPIGAIEDAKRSAEIAYAKARDRYVAAAEARDRAQSLMRQWLDGLGEVPRDLRTAEEEWRAIGASLRTAEAEALEEWLAAHEEVDDAQRDLDHARVRLTQARNREQVVDASAIIQLESREEGQVTLELRYRTPCALWRPEHVAQLDQDGTLSVITWASMWQNTGEEWKQVEVRCSTARPSRAASPPPLPEDVLFSREKSVIERRVIHVESRDQAVDTARKPDSTAAVVEEMPGVDDGGEPLEFVGSERIDVPSTGEPCRVELSRVELTAEVDRVLRPEVSRIAHMRARATLSSSVPLLAGPVRIVRKGALLGRGRMPFVAPGEPFELGMGADEAVRVKRRETTVDDDRGMTGTRTVEREVEVFLSNLSDRRRQVKVRERVPVSEVSDLDVRLLKAPAFEYDEEDGFLDATVELEPHAEETLTLNYRLKAGSKVVLPF